MTTKKKEVSVDASGVLKDVIKRIEFGLEYQEKNGIRTREIALLKEDAEFLLSLAREVDEDSQYIPAKCSCCVIADRHKKKEVSVQDLVELMGDYRKEALHKEIEDMAEAIHAMVYGGREGGSEGK